MARDLDVLLVLGSFFSVLEDVVPLTVFLRQKRLFDVVACLGDRFGKDDPLDIVGLAVQIGKVYVHVVAVFGELAREGQDIGRIGAAERHAGIVEPAPIDAPAASVLIPAFPNDDEVTVGVHRDGGVLLGLFGFNVNPVGEFRLVDPQFASGERIPAGEDVA